MGWVKLGCGNNNPQLEAENEETFVKIDTIMWYCAVSHQSCYFSRIWRINLCKKFVRLKSFGFFWLVREYNQIYLIYQDIIKYTQIYSNISKYTHQNTQICTQTLTYAVCWEMFLTKSIYVRYLTNLNPVPHMNF